MSDLFLLSTICFLVKVPKANYIAVRGIGDPNDADGNYQQAIGVLYAIAYTLKMSDKTDYKNDLPNRLIAEKMQVAETAIDYFEKLMYKYPIKPKGDVFMNKTEFGQFLKKIRMEKGITQAQLAEKLYVDATAVSKWERGINSPDISLISDICQCLDITEHELIESSKDTEYRQMMLNSKKYIRSKLIAFWCYTGAYLIAILTCFIVELCVSKKLSWFFIVLTSCACGYFATMFPILFPKLKACQTIISESAASKLSLLIYSSGLLLLTLSILISTNAYNPFNIELAIKITLYCFLILFLYGLVELFSLSRMCKLGIDSLITGLYAVSLAKVLPFLMNVKEDNYFDIDFSDWANHTNGNVALIILLSFGAIGIGLIVWSIIKALQK